MASPLLAYRWDEGADLCVDISVQRIIDVAFYNLSCNVIILIYLISLKSLFLVEPFKNSKTNKIAVNGIFSNPVPRPRLAADRALLSSVMFPEEYIL